MVKQNEISTKSYGSSVALCGIFGMLGIHHFYIGNWLHGIFDLSLFIFGFGLFSSSEQPQEGLGALLLIIDFFHTAHVFFKLIAEKQKDGDGKLIVFRVDKSSQT
jgi:hypothetical protein